MYTQWEQLYLLIVKSKDISKQKLSTTASNYSAHIYETLKSDFPLCYIDWLVCALLCSCIIFNVQYITCYKETWWH